MAWSRFSWRSASAALDLDRLVLEHLPAALVLAAVAAEGFERGLDLAQAAERLRQRRPVPVQSGVAVHEVEVGLRVEQALRLVLPVDVSDERSQLAQHAHGHQGAVDGGASLPRGLHLPAHHDLVVLRGQAVALEGRARVAALDQRLHHCEVFSRPDEVGGRTRAQKQAQRVDQDRLSRARFAGQEREAGTELQLHSVHQRDVLYFQ